MRTTRIVALVALSIVGGALLMKLKPTGVEVSEAPSASEESEVNAPPRATSKPAPRYPRELLQKRQGGKVIVLATVGETGLVTEAAVKESSGFGALDEAALDAAKQWKFKPSIQNGQITTTTVKIPFNFRINNS